MPLMEREEHEKLLTELLNPDLENTRKTEILQELRADHVTGTQDIADFTKTTDKLQKDNADLIISNSKLFRQTGIVGNKDKEEEEVKKDYSETITLEELEGAN